MDAITERKSSAAQFLADHDAVVAELETAKITMDDQRKEIEKQDITIAMQRESIAQLSTDKNRYLQYAFELSAQLQFIVAGSARALMIGAGIRNAIASAASDIPKVPGADVKELEDVLHRIGDSNAAANDGNGMTNTTKPIASAGPQDLPKGIEPPPLPETAAVTIPGFLAPNTPPVGVMVDKDGHPITPSVASQSLQLAN